MASMPQSSRSLVQFNLQAGKHDGPRLGNLTFPNRVAMETPHYLPVSSRGAVPHVTQDNMRDHTGLKSMYAALEDCESTNACAVIDFLADIYARWS